MCPDYIESAFKKYGVDLGTKEKYISYFDHFGKMEKDYSCSGICDREKLYYFSDINNGEP